MDLIAIFQIAFLALVFFLLIIILYYLYHFVNDLLRFRQLKVPHVQPIPILGNLTPFMLQRTSLPETISKIYFQFSDAKYYVFYDLVKPVYVLRDPELIISVTIKNFDYFCNHRNFVNEDLEPISGKTLFGLRDDQWRETRRHLTPAFTTNKIKMMYEFIQQCADNLTNFIVTDAGENGKTYDIKNIMNRYTNDVVASCAFGINVDSFNNPDNEFYLIGRKAITFEGLAVKMLIFKNFPQLANLLKIKFFDQKVQDFFKQIVSDSVKVRRQKGIIRPDMIHLMMETKNANGETLFNIDEMAAQAMMFFIAGFDSVSTTMSFLMQHIAVDPDIQNKLLTEINDILERTNGKPTYESVVNETHYMDAVLNEILRLYPLLTVLDRVCVKEFVLPPATPNSKPVKLKPGDVIWIQPFAIHRDSKYYSQPNDFMPERFLNGEMDGLLYMPFGIGPRMCIAKRFAIMEMKIMLFHILQRCVFEPDAKTRIPVILSKKSYMVAAEDGNWLKIRTRNPAS